MGKGLEPYSDPSNGPTTPATSSSEHGLLHGSVPSPDAMHREGSPVRSSRTPHTDPSESDPSTMSGITPVDMKILRGGSSLPISDPEEAPDTKYLAALLGIAPDIPEKTRVLLSRSPQENLREVIRWGAEWICRNNAYQNTDVGPLEGYKNAYRFLLDGVEYDVYQTAAMKSAIWAAQRDVRYWGVTDPTEESYCSECRQVREIERFHEFDHICDDCVEEGRVPSSESKQPFESLSDLWEREYSDE